MIRVGADVDIFAACALGNTTRLQTLLSEDPARVHTRTPHGKTPLHFARTRDVADLLLQAGAHLEAADESGYTPVQWIAATGQYKPLATYLRSQGAHAESTDIFWACVYGDLAAVQAFLDHDRALVHGRRPVSNKSPCSPCRRA